MDPQVTLLGWAASYYQYQHFLTAPSFFHLKLDCFFSVELVTLEQDGFLKCSRTQRLGSSSPCVFFIHLDGCAGEPWGCWISLCTLWSLAALGLSAPSQRGPLGLGAGWSVWEYVVTFIWSEMVSFISYFLLVCVTASLC